MSAYLLKLSNFAIWRAWCNSESCHYCTLCFFQHTLLILSYNTPTFQRAFPEDMKADVWLLCQTIILCVYTVIITTSVLQIKQRKKKKKRRGHYFC